MSNKINTELRRKVYRLALDGCCPALIARRLNRPHSSIQHHINELEREQAIVRVGTSTPSLYRRGPNSGSYEVGNSPSGSLSTTPPPQRIHRPWFKCRVNQPPPEDLKWWDQENTTNNTVYRRRRFVLSNCRIGTLEVCNNKTANIKIEPFDMELNETRKAEDVAATFAWELIRLAAKACQITLGVPIPIDELHYAEDVPGLKGMKIGRIQVTDTSWFDDSPGGRPEWESTDLEEKITQYQAGRRIINLEKFIVKELSEIKEAVCQLATSQKEMANAVVSLTTTITDLVKGPKDLKMKELDDQDRSAYR